jgi:hypothetical protein
VVMEANFPSTSSPQTNIPLYSAIISSLTLK